MEEQISKAHPQMRATHAQRIITSLDICARARISHPRNSRTHAAPIASIVRAPLYTRQLGNKRATGCGARSALLPNYFIPGIYLLRNSYIHIYLYVYMLSRCARRRARARAEPARVENYVSDTFAVVRRNPLKSSWT